MKKLKTIILKALLFFCYPDNPGYREHLVSEMDIRD